MKSREAIRAELVGVLRNFEGREYSGEIDDGTRFFGDLGFLSIDAILLGETLEAHFGRELPFPEFLASLAARRAQDVEVGDLVTFLHESLNG